MVGIRKEQARRFLLMKNGLLGPGALRGREGVVDYVRQAGCVQYDPVDICGRSHELALLARVKGFSRDMLEELLYRGRELIEFFDKNLCILSTDDWPYLSFVRDTSRVRTRSALEPYLAEVLALMRERGTLCEQDLSAQPGVGRMALEMLYMRGEAVIHHRDGAQKIYAPASAHLPAQLLDTADPFANAHERQMWQVMRRIGAVGMLWDASSDAWLGVDGLNAQARSEIFAALTRLGVIMPVAVQGMSHPMFILSEDWPLLESCREAAPADRRVRLLPPLDCMLWDRRLIYELFGFSYKWEIYTPEEQRRYGCYVLPVLMGEGFVGRVEPVIDRERDALMVRRFWPEEGVRVGDRFLWALEDALQTLQRFNGLGRLVWQEGWLQQNETF